MRVLVVKNGQIINRLKLNMMVLLLLKLSTKPTGASFLLKRTETAVCKYFMIIRHLKRGKNG
ncbi:MAG: hypothetical protein A3F15_01930 [Candidatus Wildermuthbacteria bacterium RIFCSPHIGHO2_12_FULL_40_12]|uniref:Uncharacterized protein n=1 Tax=Candidatus Wildermuthbacteria bacterium RIFCSPHIGHO2_12_FULL_40_12 TaxID=1802457 RepID=A0A1G2RBQ4_9BACT|nr:MAG: hypothetical protein A3F15_01930 [Candidatus Wildermuthbacteria bacterium RIFCSPHIGHO2_12_FULL_40_12]